MNIGIIGVGFVGNAIKESFKNTKLILIDPEKGYNDSYEDIKNTNAIFVCVPSPTKKDGSCDTSVLEEVLLKLKDYNGVLISKVTAPPSVYTKLSEKYKNLVYVPEFLTAANAVNDYKETKKFIIGGKINAFRNEAFSIIKLSHPNSSSIFTSIEEASLCKYLVNCFLSTKVIFMNEMYDIAEKLNVNWDSLIRSVEYVDSRVGKSHMNVPGHDNTRGFGGVCFPKDTKAFLNYADSLGISLDVLKQVIDKNNFYHK